MDITLRELLLAGIGSMAYTYDKAQEMVAELVKKGEIAVKEGRELSEELKRKADTYRKEQIPETVESIKQALKGMNLATKKDIDELRARIEELEKNRKDS